MQLTKAEINNTHLIVTTPEKWDVVTRKASGEEDLVSVNFIYFWPLLTHLYLSRNNLTMYISRNMETSAFVHQL